MGLYDFLLTDIIKVILSYTIGLYDFLFIDVNIKKKTQISPRRYYTITIGSWVKKAFSRKTIVCLLDCASKQRHSLYYKVSYAGLTVLRNRELADLPLWLRL